MNGVFCLIVCFSLIASGAYCSELRGLNPESKASYIPGRVFTCLDGSSSIPFSHVNDDYCDCRDGSDEPGTSACPNGLFYCHNIGHKVMNIISSRVNDGVCDCCDGTDEYDSSSTCANTCVDMGKKAVEDAKQLKELHKQGFIKKQEYVSQGKDKIENARYELSEKQSQVEAMKDELEVLRSAKEVAEEPERDAKEKHKHRWEAHKEQRQQDRRISEAKIGFDELDTNSDGYVSIEEIQARPELDDDDDGIVSETEALEYLDNVRQIEFDDFLNSVWDLVSDKCHFQKPAQPVLPTAPPPDDNGDDPDDYDYEDEDNKEEDDVNEAMPEYDQATKDLIAMADEARVSFTTSERAKNDLELAITQLNKFLAMDFGGDNEFTGLYDNCYDYTDLEYTYRMCAFGKVTQKPKNGGRETNLGNWGNWDEDGYNVMVYDNGEKCWNGPSRSATIKLRCGLEDQLISASEPNRCEYAMDFTSPSVCHEAPPHDEL